MANKRWGAQMSSKQAKEAMKNGDTEWKSVPAHIARGGRSIVCKCKKNHSAACPNYGLKQFRNNGIDDMDQKDY